MTPVTPSRRLFPHLIPAHSGVVVVFAVAPGLSFVAALASLLRRQRYLHVEPVREVNGTAAVEAPAVPVPR